MQDQQQEVEGRAEGGNQELWHKGTGEAIPVGLQGSETFQKNENTFFEPEVLFELPEILNLVEIINLHEAAVTVDNPVGVIEGSP